MNCVEIIEKLEKFNIAEKDELAFLLENITDGELEELRKKAQKKSLNVFQTKSISEA